MFHTCHVKGVYAFLGAGGWERRICVGKCCWWSGGLWVLPWAVLFHSPSAGSLPARACSEEHVAAIQGMRGGSQPHPEYENPSRKEFSLHLLYKKTHVSRFLCEV